MEDVRYPKTLLGMLEETREQLTSGGEVLTQPSTAAWLDLFQTVVDLQRRVNLLEAQLAEGG